MDSISLNMTDSRSSGNNKKGTTYRNTLVSELPRIDAALKSYCSWYAVAGNEGGMNINEVLLMTRKLSLSINHHVFPVEMKSSSHEYLVCSKLWNEIVSTKQKPTKWLGKTALQLAWKDLDLLQSSSNNETNETKKESDDDKIENQNKEAFTEFVKQFEHLLFTEDSNDTASLIWNYSEAELARRAKERREVASQRLQEVDKASSQEGHDVTGPIIEVLNEDEDE